jgi:hypothetical protein
MSEIFTALPGIEVPVGGIAKGLAQMWADTEARGGAAPGSDDARAMQANFVLLLGFGTTPDDALTQFQSVVRFSQRYPSRVVILCPQREGDGMPEMRAKIYGECFLGKSKADKRCVEFVILSYPHAAREHLENQVSVCLSTDLPLYYWVHRFTSCARVAGYRYLLSRASRVLFDSATAPADALTFAWPRSEIVRDLANARLLHVRQSLGQFLSRYPAEVLAKDLKVVVLDYDPQFLAEARVLLAWTRERLEGCGAGGVEFKLLTPQTPARHFSFSLTFAYLTEEMRLAYATAAGEKRKPANVPPLAEKFFSWEADLATGYAQFDANFGTGRTTLPASVSLLPPETALSEAMFF